MSDEVDIRHDIHGKSRPRDRELAALAARQHGVVARRQLVALGFGKGAIHHRIAVGRLHPVHQGVYAVGHRRISGNGAWMAAVLAAGPDALLSHVGAAALWGLLRTSSARVDVTVAGRTRRGPARVALHRVSTLHQDDRAIEEGIPVTSVVRTLVDLAGTVQRLRLERAFEEAERLRLLDMRKLEELVERSRGRRGSKAIGQLLATNQARLTETRSELERRFVDFCGEAGLPQPGVNRQIEGFEVDAVWERQRVIVELDGYAYHRTRGAFERDRARDAALQVAGYRVLRLTHRRLKGEPAAVLTDLRSLLF